MIADALLQRSRNSEDGLAVDGHELQKILATALGVALGALVVRQCQSIRPQARRGVVSLFL